jgi:ubiquinone/menaquinone biosynthesis C-methylase UbiE
MLREWRHDHTRAAADSIAILDAGCGDGINLVGLREIVGDEHVRARIAGVDYNPVRLARARQADDQASLQHATLYALPYVDGSFDVVLCNHVIEHVPDVATALRELVRVLRPGGLLIMGTPNEGCLMGRARNRYVQPKIGRDTDHVHFFTAWTLARTLREAGVRVDRIERETFFFPCSHANACCNEFAVGHWLMAGLRRLFPSQAGGLIVACEKPATEGRS